MSRGRSDALGFVLALAALALGPRAAEAKGPKSAEGGASFDRAAAASVLAAVDLAKCRATNAPRGEGHVTVTFAPAGSVDKAVVDRGAMAGTPVAKCIQARYASVRVPAFRGDAVAVGKTFRLD